MDNYKNIFNTEGNDQPGLTLRLSYMVEDFMELIKREEEEITTEES